MRGLDDRVVIVTGATKAMGAAIARRFAEEGSIVVGCGRSADLGQQVAEDIRCSGGRASFLQADVTEEADVAAVVAFACETFGRLDVVVNNAAAIDVIRGGGESPVTTEPNDVFERMIKTGLYAPFWFCKYAIPSMIDSGGGSFVHLSSVAAIRGLGGVPGYAASKGGLEALSRQVGTDFGPQGIRSNTIQVGAIRTPDNARLHEHPVAGPILTAQNMLPRVGMPEDIAAVAAFLASDDAAFVTGVVVPVDGGASTKFPVLSMDAVYGETVAS
jgi:NAD(P)-dependent dehydrogenase (short-subunit alcohol dehydrogenase family)